MAKLILTYVAVKAIVETGTPEEILRISNLLIPMGFGDAVNAAREKIVTAKAIEAKALVTQFNAHTKVGNTGAMQSTLRKLRQADLQAGLVRHFGSVEERDRFFGHADYAIELANRAKADRKKKRRTAKVAA